MDRYRASRRAAQLRARTMPDRVPAPVDWEAFYHGYRKPGYVPGFEILHRIGAGSFGIVFNAASVEARAFA